jgi:hypothetical protein
LTWCKGTVQMRKWTILDWWMLGNGVLGNGY